MTKGIFTYAFVLLLTILQWRSGKALDVRLAGGTQATLGRVEVYHNGQWGSVCDDKWTHVNCMVVCSQLGFTGGTMLQSADGFGTCTGPIFLDDVECNGDELGLGECIMSNFGTHNCNHKEDVACQCDATASGTCVSGFHRITPLKAHLPWVGRAEVYSGGAWSAICDDHWDDLDAKVFCSCLGAFNDSAHYRAYWSPSLSELSTISLAYDAVKCTEVDVLTKKSIWDCSTTPATGACSGSVEAAGVACGPAVTSVTPDGPTTSLTCKDGLLSACFTSSSYNMAAAHLKLTPTCQQAVSRNMTGGVCYDIDMEKCTAEQMWSDSSQKHFCYDLSYSRFDSQAGTLLTDAVWTRRACCSQDKNGTATAQLQPDLEGPPPAPAYATSPVNFTLDCFIDEAFSQPLSPASILLHGQTVFCRVSASVWESSLYLVVPSCSFQASGASGSPSYPFLTNKCPTSNVFDLSFYGLDHHNWGFGFAVPMFQHYNDLYLSCEAYVCDPRLDPKPYCDRTCQAGSRRRRDVAPSGRHGGNHAEVVVHQGPFKVRPTGAGPLIATRTQAWVVDSSQSVPPEATYEVHQSLQTNSVRTLDHNRTPKDTATKTNEGAEHEYKRPAVPEPVLSATTGGATASIYGDVSTTTVLSMMIVFVHLSFYVVVLSLSC